MFLECERKLSGDGNYHRQNLGMMAEGLGDLSFAHDVGKLDKKQAETHSLEAFAKARARCFELLGQPAGSADKLGFVDYVNGRALAFSS